MDEQNKQGSDLAAMMAPKDDKKKALIEFLKKNKRLVGIISAASIFVFILVIMLAGRGKAVKVSYATTGRTDMKIAISASGTIQPAHSQDIKTQMTGKVKELFVGEGSVVKKGGPICTVDNPAIQSEIVTMWLDLRASRADLKQTEEDFKTTAVLELERAKQRAEVSVELYKQKALAKIEVVSAELDYEKAKSAYARAEGSLNKLRASITKKELDLKGLFKKYAMDEEEFAKKKALTKDGVALFELVISAPFDGTITDLSIDVGGEVSGKEGKICTLVDMSTWIVTADIDETDVTNVKIGQPVQVKSGAAGTEIMDGKVTMIGSVVKRMGMTRTVEVECGIEDTGGLRLRPGTAGRLKIITSSLSGVIAVPLESVFKKDGGSVVYVLNGNTAVMRNVKTGKSDRDSVEVVDGLKEEEKVVTTGALDLEGKIRAKVVIDKGKVSR